MFQQMFQNKQELRFEKYTECNSLDFWLCRHSIKQIQCEIPPEHQTNIYSKRNGDNTEKTQRIKAELWSNLPLNALHIANMNLHTRWNGFAAQDITSKLQLLFQKCHRQKLLQCARCKTVWLCILGVHTAPENIYHFYHLSCWITQFC